MPVSRRHTPKRAPRRVPASAPPAGPDFPTDADLGIGVEDEIATGSAEVAALSALLETPAMKALIERAVASRLAQMAGPATGTLDGTAFDKLSATLGHMIEVNAMQQPGYIKPLPAGEVDRRLAGKVEMEALLKRYEEAGTPPLWTVGKSGFFECANAQEFPEGAKIRTYLPPVEDFIPGDAKARKVQAAMFQWLGGPTPGIGEQVEAAQRAANIPLVGNTPIQAPRGPVEIVSLPEASAPPPSSRKRTMGTVVAERREVSMADRAAGPQGPAFGEAA